MRFSRNGPGRTAWKLSVVLIAALLPAWGIFAGTWTPLARQAPGSVELMMLLPDGTVIAANQSGGSNWFRLTPDLQGSYVNGTWTTLAAMHDDRLYYSSAVLRDGRVFVAGGEYGSGKTHAEVYDPANNTWTLLPPAGQSFSDSISKILPNGTVLISPVGPSVSGGTVIFDPGLNAWRAGPKLFRGTGQNEASWVKLADESIITIDPFGVNSERYIPSLNRWINDAIVPVSLYNGISEIGGGVLLPDGRAFFIGGTSHTAIYTPSGTTNAGTWAAGPDIPAGLGASDAAAAMMSNGKVLCAVGSASTYDAPTSFYEYDPVANSFTQVNGPTGLSDNVAPYESTMLDLPDGNVLYAHFGSQLYSYQPDGPSLAAGKPVIATITQNADGSYHLTGTQLNGISEGAVYGDDAQMDSNYPLIRLTNSGNVYYARTWNWSSTGVMTSNQVVSTEFVVPESLPAGSNSLVVIANGISSDPVSFLPRALKVSPSTGFLATGPAGGPFNGAAKSFALTNGGTASLGWSLMNTSTWLTASPAAGALSPGSAAATVNVSLNAVANNLLPGTYISSVVFSNVNDASTQTRTFALQVRYPNDFQPYRNMVMSFNPPGYWRLNETNQPPTDGIVVNSGNLGAAANGEFELPTFTAGALRGDADTAASFTGGNAVSVDYISQFSLSPPFTIEAWVKPGTAQTGANVVCPLACGHFASPRSGWLVYQSATGWNFRLYDQNGLNPSLNIETGGAPVVGVWYHVTAVYDGAQGSIYVNGAGTPGTPATLVPNVDGPLTVGARSDGGFGFNGSIDEVAIYNSVLSPADILNHYQAGTNSSPPTPYDQIVLSQNPMVYYRLDGPVLPPVAVNEGSLGAGANGFYEPGTVPGLGGAMQNGFVPNNYACQFNGLVGYVDISGTSLNFTGPVTVVAWAKANPANGVFQTIVGKGDKSYRLDLDPNGRPGFSDGQQAIGDLFGPNRVDDGLWHQLAGVYDGSHSEFLYVDGQLAASTNAATTPVAGTPANLWLGGAPDYALARIFSGTLEEVAIFNAALSSNQIRQLYSAAFTVPPVFNTMTRLGDTLVLGWSALTGRAYQVQYKADLNQINWSNLAGTVIATNSTAFTSDSITNRTKLFYRVFLAP